MPMQKLLETALQTCSDLLPIVLIVLVFQWGILRSRPAQLQRVLAGSAYALAGLILFRLGLDLTLLPLGSDMAQELAGKQGWGALWLVLFAGSIGLVATLIEPTLLAVANRIQDLTGGEMRAWDLRLVVAGGVALGLVLGTARMLLGIPILAFIVPMVLLLLVVGWVSPKNILALSLDTGPMATSVVTVPLIAAFGGSVARTLPGRDPVLEGFGLIFFALMTPVLSLLMFAALKAVLSRKKSREET
mgnify:CR=1 FL=1|jgi:hypothetical protein